jgi:hypothetical protein
MKTIKNLQPHQNETTVWRDVKRKQKNVKARDLASLQGLPTATSIKLKPERPGSFPLTEKAKPSMLRLVDTEAQALQQS